MTRSEFSERLAGEEQRGGAPMSRMNERKRMGPKSTELRRSFSVGSCTNGAQGRQNRARVLKNTIFNFLTKKTRNFANISTPVRNNIALEPRKLIKNRLWKL